METELFKNNKYAIVSSDNMWDFIDKIEEVKKNKYKLIKFTTSTTNLKGKKVITYSALFKKRKLPPFCEKLGHKK